MKCVETADVETHTVSTRDSKEVESAGKHARVEKTRIEKILRGRRRVWT